MINSLKIANFQSWQEVALDFSHGVNAIIGLSDSGKSAIIRAIRWLVWNRPLGDDFRSWWDGDTWVTATIEKGIEIERGKDRQFNGYLIREKNGQTSSFQAIKAEVPEEVQKTLNIGEINIQLQLGRPFLLDDSPGEVGTHFNRIAHLDSIDTGTQNVQKWKRQIEQDITSGKRYLEQQREELKTYDHLVTFEREVHTLEVMQGEQESIQQRVVKLRRLIDEIRRVREEEQKLARVLSVSDLVDAVSMKIEARGTQQREQDLLSSLILDITKTNTKIGELQHLLALESMVGQVITEYRRREEQHNKIESLSQLIIDIGNTQQSHDSVAGELGELIEQFEANFPDICPLSGKTCPLGGQEVRK